MLQRSQRAKRLVLSVKPRQGVRVAIPRGSTFKEAQAFAEEKAEWIRGHIDAVRQAEREQQALNLAPIDAPAAKEALTNRLQVLAEKHGFSYNGVTIRNQRTRWGSCSPKNRISLNMKLVRLPPDLIDYVILHELVHTRVKNHSQTFWDELDKYVTNANGKRARMKTYWLGLP